MWLARSIVFIGKLSFTTVSPKPPYLADMLVNLQLIF